LGSLYSQNMFLSETKGLTHWIFFYDGSQIYAWNVVRNAFFTLIQKKAVKILAVDSVKGYLFLVDDIQVLRYTFRINLGEDRMNPSIELLYDSNITLFKDDSISSIAIDSDQSALYISSDVGITLIIYDGTSPSLPILSSGQQQLLLYENIYANSIAVNMLGDLFLS
jgi:hypothetical protein